jgi:hypothetical protein
MGILEILEKYGLSKKNNYLEKIDDIVENNEFHKLYREIHLLNTFEKAEVKDIYNKKNKCYLEELEKFIEEEKIGNLEIEELLKNSIKKEIREGF